jgi:hypothetical protein
MQVTFWQASTRIIVKQTFNLTEGIELTTDLIADAEKFSSRHNNSLETLHAEYIG